MSDSLKSGRDVPQPPPLPKTKSILPMIGAALCIVFTAFSTATMWVFSAAALANASHESIQRVKLWVAGFSSLSLVCVVVALWLLCAQRAGRSAAFALLPSVVMGACLAYKLIS